MSAIRYPTSPAELSDALRNAADARSSIQLYGNNSKRAMGGPVTPADIQISTSSMRRILQYEPRDLTISVEAGLPYSELARQLATNGQMIPLAGSFSPDATIGGIVAANIAESRRRAHGTARDLVIGMEFATLEGKLVRSGGMVVKNVAGLDMGKLMIGSFGTLAGIATLNFKLLPLPTVARTLLLQFEQLPAAITALQTIQNSGLNPLSADLFNPVLAALFNPFNVKGHVLALQFGGNDAVIERSLRESIAAAPQAITHTLQADEEQKFWTAVAAAVPRHLEKFSEGVIVRIATPLSEAGEALATVEGAGHAHAASGVVRAFFTRPDAATRWLASSLTRNWKGVIEYAGSSVDRTALELWPKPGSAFAIMKEIKKMFDPGALLNRGRLYNVI